jgi:penicillin-binding protein 2
MTSFHPNSVARRGRIASMGLIILFTLLAGRFFLIQVLQHQQYALQSDQNRLNEVPIPAPRGIIYDRNGLIIAENVPGYTVSILAPQVDSLKAMLGRISKRVELSRKESIAVLRRRALSSTRPTVIFGDARYEVVSVLEEHRTEFPGLIIQSAPKRLYADSSAVSAFAGYTSEITEAELEDTARIRIGYKPSQQIGKAGLERQYEAALRGLEGSRFVEVDARGRVVRDVGVRAERAAVTGAALRTNIELNLQRHIAKLFGDSIDGSAVVMDPKTGAVIAIHSAPGYNPNHFIGGISTAEFKALNEDPRRPMANKAFQGIYEPGSTWKLATAVIGLERGAVRVHDYMPQRCTGGFQMGNRRWRCWEKAGHGSLDLIGAIRHSCDVYFYQLGQRLTFDTLIAGGRKLGFGARTGIDLPYEQLPDFPPAPTARKKALRDSLTSARDSLGKRLLPHVVDSLVRVLGDSTLDIIGYYNRKFRVGGWSAPAEELNLSIGQGANASTLISMARFYTALATDGHMARPMLVGDKPDTTRIFKITDEQMQDLRTAMVAVVSAGGTAASANIKGLSFAGKTGSAQNPRDPNRDHAWFVGMAPADNPQIVVAVFVEFGLHGYIAARIAKSIVEFHFKQSVTAAPATTGGD